MGGAERAPGGAGADLYLAFLTTRPDGTLRSCGAGHVTASAMVFSHVRFVRRAAPGAALRVSEESHDVAWWPVDALPDGTFEDVRLLAAAGGRLLAGRS